jgi:hypothetical protein
MDSPPAPRLPSPPYEPLPAVSAALRAAIEREALRVNDRYLHDFIEEHAFCPFARAGRLAGQTSRYVLYADTPSVEPILALMARVAADPQQVVAQVILPLVEVDPDAWIRFCDEVTAAGHARLGGPPTLAFAALHPALRYHTGNPFALIPLFRRAPDPTLQWARLDALADLYAGRGTEHRFVDPDDIVAFVRDAPPPRPPLYDRVAETNAEMARHLGLARVEAQLADQAADARRSYRRLFVEHELAPDEDRL